MVTSQEKARRVLVVGGAGYVGNILVRRLLHAGYGVTCMDALLYPTGQTIAPLLDDPRFSFYRGDVCDLRDIRSALAGVTDVVLLAALVGDPISKKYPQLSRDVNQAAACRLIGELNGRGIERFVFTSTCSNYGILAGGALATEESPLNPKSIYAETKVAVEEFIKTNAATLDYAPTVLRLATAFGLSPRMRFDLTISEFARELAMGRDLLVYDENTWRPYCHVVDIADAIIRVIEAPSNLVSGEVFNVGGNSNNFTKRMVLDEIGKLVPDARVSFKAGGFDPRDYRVSFDKIKGRLGFEPQYFIPESIAHVVHGVRSGLFSGVETQPTFYGNYSVVERAIR